MQTAPRRRAGADAGRGTLPNRPRRHRPHADGRCAAPPGRAADRGPGLGRPLGRQRAACRNSSAAVRDRGPPGGLHHPARVAPTGIPQAPGHRASGLCHPDVRVAAAAACDPRHPARLTECGDVCLVAHRQRRVVVNVRRRGRATVRRTRPGRGRLRRRRCRGLSGRDRRVGPAAAGRDGRHPARRGAERTCHLHSRGRRPAGRVHPRPAGLPGQRGRAGARPMDDDAVRRAVQCPCRDLRIAAAARHAEPAPQPAAEAAVQRGTWVCPRRARPRGRLQCRPNFRLVGRQAWVSAAPPTEAASDGPAGLQDVIAALIPGRLQAIRRAMPRDRGGRRAWISRLRRGLRTPATRASSVVAEYPKRSPRVRRRIWPPGPTVRAAATLTASPRPAVG